MCRYAMSNDNKSEILHRELSTERENPAPQIAETVAEIEETSITELSTIYGCIDGVLDEIFSNPPSPEAQMEVTFSYEGYRISVEQNGTARFVKMD